MVTEQTPAERPYAAAALLPARHPMLRDAAVILSIISTICYFAFSEGVAGFLGFVLKIFARLVHAS
jgi:hypothetical protein